MTQNAALNDTRMELIHGGLSLSDTVEIIDVLLKERRG